MSTSIGLRPFLTLTLASLAMHFGYLHPAHAFAYLGNGGATWLLGGLAALEFAGDKIPVVDHALHVVHFATKPIAAAVLVGSVLPATGSPGPVTYALMGLGAANALGIHTGVAAVRGASTAATLGMANPFVSLVEDVLAVGATVLAFVFPFVGALLAFALTLLLLILVARTYRALRRGRSSVAMS
ncbi:MAG: DUF4126 domain-containing protein [Candidatus Eremiobacteraeota bacterium]|nr:DUF4126 domain-containing protein [Candidatus Eremiobacteraeota bacterium]